MRLLQALSTLWDGFVSIFIDSTAKAHPEAAYAGVIQDLKVKRERIANATARVALDRDRRQVEFDRVSRELAAAERQLKGAVALKDRDAGPLLIAKVKQLRDLKGSLEPDLITAKNDVENVKRELKAFEAKIKEVQAESVTKIAKFRSAQARNEMRALIQGLSVDGSMQLLEAVRNATDTEIAKANVQSEIDGTGLDAQLAKAQEVGDKIASNSEFDALVAQFETTQGVTSAVSPAETSDGIPGGKSV